MQRWALKTKEHQVASNCLRSEVGADVNKAPSKALDCLMLGSLFTGSVAGQRMASQKGLA